MVLLPVWLVAPAHAATIELRVPDPKVREVILECEDGVYRAEPKGGMVTFEHLPHACNVVFVRATGTIDSTGKWTCAIPDGCTRTEVEHQRTEDAPNRVNVLISNDVAPGTTLEVTCSGGFRVRQPVVKNTAVFDGIPNQECTLYIKGATVWAKYSPLTPGTWTCTLSGGTAICHQ
ncbi:MAG: hypothetical protein R3F59_20050 [Myxococcota bacterium]